VVKMPGFESEPLFEGISVTGPTLVGVIVNVCGAAVLLNVSTTGMLSPPPDGVMVMVPL
jgi:hypothetical protein